MSVIARGTAYLVGAGPGDPGLLTRRGLEILRAADVVIYDRLASPELLLEARPDARLHYVGKESSRHALTQDQINELIYREAAAGQAVCRLKGGDPFVFGRGGEEADYLRERGLPFEIVPGVTSAIAVPAYTGIPVTDRRAASSVAFATGHERADGGSHAIDWGQLARAADTLVVLMGMKNLPEIVAAVRAAGRGETTPAAVIQWGTTPKHRFVISDLAHIIDEVERAGLSAPAIFVLGEVAAIGQRLHWFDPGPLRGLRVLVTRPRHQASALAERLREAGAEPVVCSVVRTEPIAVEPARLRELMSQHWDWVIFTSANGVTAFRDDLLAAGLDWRALAESKLAVMGPGTGQPLAEAGLRVDFTPSRAIAESLAEELPDIGPGTRVLIPRAEEARDVLPQLLSQAGAQVEILPVYRTVPDETGLSLLTQALEEGVDVITFTSSSGVKALVGALGAEALRDITIACIGPITADTARDLGLHVTIVSERHTILGLVDALISACGDARDPKPETRDPSGVNT